MSVILDMTGASQAVPVQAPPSGKGEKKVERNIVNKTIDDIFRENFAVFFKKDPSYARRNIPDSPQGDPSKLVPRFQAILLGAQPGQIDEYAFDCIQRANPMLSNAHQMIDANTRNDLRLVSGTENNPNTYIGNIFYKEDEGTRFAKAYTLSLIGSPTNDETVLEGRKYVIGAFAANAALRHALKSKLDTMSEGEAEIASFDDPSVRLPGCVSKQYFKMHPRVNEFLNSSPVALNASATFEVTTRLAEGVTQTASAAFFSLYALNSLVGVLGEDNAEFLEGYTNRYISASGPLYPLAYSVAGGATAAVAGGMAAVNLQSKWEWIIADSTIDSVVQHKLVKVADYYRKMKEIYTMCQGSTIASQLEHFSKLKDFFENRSLQSLFKALESSTFDAEASFFFNRGNCLLVWDCFQNKKVREVFGEAMMAVGEIETYVRAAELLNESQTKKAHYCLPEYVQEGPVSIEMVDVWHPFVDPDKVVLNSIALGRGTGSSLNNLMITSPNAAGKTTVLSAMAVAEVLAHSIPVVPCTRMKTSKLKRITSSMGLKGDLAEGMSSYQKQLKFNADLNKQLDALQEGEYAFNILDELLTGTSKEEQEPLLQSIAEDLASRKQVVSIIVTHARDVASKVEETTKGVFTNYQIPMREEAGSDKLIPTYTLAKGISTQSTAMQVARQQGISDDILDRAEDIRQLTNGVSQLSLQDRKS